MKKVVTIHMAGEVFQMEEDGYNNIQKVLKKIEAGSANGPSLVKDIEQRIGSLLKEKASSENLVTSEQVNEVIESLGYAAYLKDESRQANQNTWTNNGNNPPKPSYKRLYRHPDDKVLGGVCGGLAAYVNTDPVIMRVLFVVLFGFGFFIYLIMWIIIPQARTPEQISHLNQ
jgi:phage shock protein C